MKLPKNYGSIVKLPGNRRRAYAVVKTIGYTDKGTQIRQYLAYFETKKKALDFLHEHNKKQKKDYITYDILFNEYYKKKIEPLEKNRQKLYIYIFKKLKPFKDININSIDKKDFMEHIKLLKYSVYKQVKSLLLNLELEAKKKDILIKEYSKIIENHNTKEKVKKRPFTNEEIEILWANYKGNNTIILTLILIYTGVRVNELLKLKCENIDLLNNIIITGSKTEAGKNRTVPIHYKIKDLMVYLKSNINIVNIEYETFRVRFKKELNKLNMKHTIHETRHTFASLMFKNGANALTTSKILGHKNYNTTATIYTHIDQDILQQELDKI